jgi:hypothetical protein
MAGKENSKRRSNGGSSSKGSKHSKRGNEGSSNGGKSSKSSMSMNTFGTGGRSAKSHPNQGLSVPVEMNVSRLPDETDDSSDDGDDSDGTRGSYVHQKKAPRKSSYQQKDQHTPEKSDLLCNDDEAYDDAPTSVRPFLNQFLPASTVGNGYASGRRNQIDLPKVYTPQTKQLLDQLQRECLALNNTISVMKEDALRQAELHKLHQEAAGRVNERAPEILNEVQQAVVGKYVRAKIFKQIKFVNGATFRAHTGIINKCLDALGVLGDTNRNLHWKAVKSNIMYHLSQLRNFVKGKLLAVYKRKCCAQIFCLNQHFVC